MLAGLGSMQIHVDVEIKDAKSGQKRVHDKTGQSCCCGKERICGVENDESAEIDGDE